MGREGASGGGVMAVWRRRWMRQFADLFADSPLRRIRFRRFYIGSTGTALGYTMQGTLAAWLMTTLTPSVLMVALVQTAGTLPSLLFGFVAGALADIVDRRRVVLAAQALLLVSTLVLGLATWFGLVGPVGVLLLSFTVGAGFAFYIPAQQALLNDLVPRDDLPRAVSLIAVSFNAARSVGPALAGAIAALIGLGSALVVSAACFAAMLLALRGWRGTRGHHVGIPETIISGIRTGLRYTRHSPPLRALVIRNLAFSSCASALWALFPVIARDQLQLGASGFGVLLSCFGAGAIVGALLMPRHLRKVSLNTVITGGVVLWALATAAIAVVPYVAAAVIGAFAAGAAWVSVHASLSAGTQSSAPGWVRARAVSMSWVSLQASLAIGSLFWGIIAVASGTRVALFVSALIALLLLLLFRKVRVTMGGEADVKTGVHMPELTLAGEPMPDDGPVIIQLAYRIAPEKRDAFLEAIHRNEWIRRRNGASGWLVFRDLEDDGRFVERFVIDSWAEYLRLRARMTVAERALQAEVVKMQREGEPVRISRFIRVGPADPDAEDDPLRE